MSMDIFISKIGHFKLKNQENQLPSLPPLMKHIPLSQINNLN